MEPRIGPVPQRVPDLAVARAVITKLLGEKELSVGTSPRQGTLDFARLPRLVERVRDPGLFEMVGQAPLRS